MSTVPQKRSLILNPCCREALEEAEKVAQGMMPTGPDPIGPLHGAGMAFAVKRIVESIAALKGAARDG